MFPGIKVAHELKTQPLGLLDTVTSASSSFRAERNHLKHFHVLQEEAEIRRINLRDRPERWG